MRNARLAREFRQATIEDHDSSPRALAFAAICVIRGTFLTGATW